MIGLYWVANFLYVTMRIWEEKVTRIVGLFLDKIDYVEWRVQYNAWF